MSSTDLEQEIGDLLAQEITKTIDFKVIGEMLVFTGWTQVEIDYGVDKKWVDVMNWVDEIATDEYKEHNGVWLFKNVKDALMFRLKWT